MTEQTKEIKITPEQELFIRELDAKIQLAEVELIKLQRTRYMFLVEQELIEPAKQDDSEQQG
ncbi:hypothetical protein P9477_23730 [Enterobacter mori]|uniref:hypothetical protein n=1 Tax=Enterobacter mori TaxID=539813 RepID=UPI00398BB5BF